MIAASGPEAEVTASTAGSAAPGARPATGPSEAGLIPGGLMPPGDVALPRLPASAGALLWDAKGRILVLNPTYKGGWTIPGGVMEASGESPWEACQREAWEECGIFLERGRLACVDFRRPRIGRPGGLRFLFDCGVIDKAARAGLALQAEEISESRWVRPQRAYDMLSGPVSRRVRAAVLSGGMTCYLEDGRPVRGVAGLLGQR